MTVVKLARVIQSALDARAAQAHAEGRRQGIEEAAKVAKMRLFPKNPKSDWTSFAKGMAQAALTAEGTILALLEPKEAG